MSRLIGADVVLEDDGSSCSRRSSHLSGRRGQRLQRGASPAAEIVGGVARVLCVTEMMGLGFNAVTGGSSRGAGTSGSRTYLRRVAHMTVGGR